MNRVWYVFNASGQSELYGFGLEYSAEIYTDMLNQGRSVCFYSYRLARADEIGTAEMLGFSLEDETSFIAA